MSSNLYRKLTLKHLKLVSILGRELSMTRAAELLHTSPPGLSRSLSQIEALLNVALFDRTTRSMSLTPAGKSLYRHATIILNQLEQAQDEIEGLSKGRLGKLSIGIIPAFSHELMASAIRELQSLNPDIKIDIRSGEPTELFPQLLDGTIEVLLSHAEFSADMENIRIHELYQEESAIICDAVNPILEKTSLTSEDIAACAWVLPKADTTLRKALNRALFVDRPNRAGVSDIEADSFAQYLAIIEGTEMLAILPRQRALAYQKLGKIKIVNTPVALLKGPMCCMTLKSVLPDTSTQLFMDILHKSAPV